MITVKFFSLVREALGVQQLDVQLTYEGMTVMAVKEYLVSMHGEHWREVLFQPNVVHALNHRVVDVTTSVEEGAELAFFPPMTGG